MVGDWSGSFSVFTRLVGCSEQLKVLYLRGVPRMGNFQLILQDLNTCGSFLVKEIQGSKATSKVRLFKQGGNMEENSDDQPTYEEGLVLS